MDVFKLRLKLGSDEFEAEGSQEYVEKQRDIFLERHGQHEDKRKEEQHHDSKSGAKPPAEKTPAPGAPPKPPAPQDLPVSAEAMGKIVGVKDDVVTLTLMPGGDNAEADSLLLILLGHKILRNEDLIQAEDLLKGMTQSGFPNVDRLDRVTKNIDSSHVSSVGNRRGKKYRLLNPGIAKAKELAEKLISTVA
jgi:hypothetical protein